MLSTLGSIYQGLNSMTGGRLNKFIVKNAGKLAGHGLNAVGSGLDWVGNKIFKKTGVKQKMSNLANNISNNITKLTGDKNEVSKQINNAAKVMRGENVAFENINENPVNNLSALTDINQQTALIPYVKNVGGSNYHKVGISSLGRNKRRRRRF